MNLLLQFFSVGTSMIRQGKNISHLILSISGFHSANHLSSYYTTFHSPQLKACSLLLRNIIKSIPVQVRAKMFLLRAYVKAHGLRFSCLGENLKHTGTFSQDPVHRKHIILIARGDFAEMRRFSRAPFPTYMMELSLGGKSLYEAGDGPKTGPSPASWRLLLHRTLRQRKN